MINHLLLSIILLVSIHAAHAQTVLQQNYDSRSYNFVATNGLSASGDLSSAGAGNVITLSRRPFGVVSGGSVRISGGTGAAEVVAVTALSGTAGAAGTITVTTANAHTGSWAVGSASGGIQEAVCSMPTAGGGAVVAADTTLYAAVTACSKTRVTVNKLPGIVVTGAFAVLGDPYLAGITGPVTIGNSSVAASAFHIDYAQNSSALEPYDVGDTAALGVYVGSASTMGVPGHGVQSFMHMDSTWPTSGKPYAAYRADVIASAGTVAAPVGIFISATSESTTAEAYGVWSTVSSSTGVAGSFTHGLLNGYFEARDYTGAGTAITNMAAMELNINTHSGPSDLFSGHLGVNIVRQCQAPCAPAGDIMSGTAVQAAGSGNGQADWAGFLRFLQGYDAAYVMHLENRNSAGVLGMWRLYNSVGQLSWRTNTAVARDFSTFNEPFIIDTSANVYLGGSGGGGGAITAYFTANNGLIVLGGGPGDAISVKTTIPTATPLGLPGIKSTTGTRFLCIDTAGVVTSSASACSGT